MMYYTGHEHSAPVFFHSVGGHFTKIIPVKASRDFMSAIQNRICRLSLFHKGKIISLLVQNVKMSFSCEIES